MTDSDEDSGSADAPLEPLVVDHEGRWSPEHLQMGWIGRFERRFGPLGTGIVGFFGCGTALGIAGIIAWLTNLPWVFPSLGPTALLLFETPLRPQASPRHTLVGHGIAIVAGYGTLVVFGLASTPAATVSGFTPARIGAASLAVALTTLLLHALHSAHPPAGATALIVSLGILRTGVDLGVIAAGILTVTILAWSFNRASGIEVPLWSPRAHAQAESVARRTGPEPQA